MVECLVLPSAPINKYKMYYSKNKIKKVFFIIGKSKQNFFNSFYHSINRRIFEIHVLMWLTYHGFPTSLSIMDMPPWE